MSARLTRFAGRRTTLQSDSPEVEQGAPVTGPATASGDRRSALVGGIIVALVALVVALAAVFASARSSVQVAELGSQGIYDEAVLSAAATTRNRAVQAFLVQSAATIGVADQSEVTRAVEATELGVAEMTVRVDRLSQQLAGPEERRLVQDAAGELSVALESLLGQLRRGEAGSETQLALIDGAYEALAELLAEDRDVVLHELDLAQEDAGRIANAARFLVAFAIPLGAAFAFRRSVRRRQRQLELVQEVTRQREIAQTKDNFIADLSHELRTPLTSIYGFASTLLDEKVASNPELTVEFATLIAMESDELGRMIDDLLTAARADDDALTFRHEQVDPQAEVEAVLAPMRAMGVEIVSKLSGELLRADRLRLRQVLRNLLSNALKHGEPPIALTGRVERNRYVLAVTDCGPGVPPELEARLFQRFIHQGRDPLLTGSVGLGLSIARLLVRRMGGNLAYRRSDGLTTFLVELPLWEESGDTVPKEHDAELQWLPNPPS